MRDLICGLILGFITVQSGLVQGKNTYANDRLIRLEGTFTVVQSGGMGPAVTLDNTSFATVTNATQGSTGWTWMSPLFPLMAASPYGPDDIDAQLWRNSSGPVQIRFVSPGETVVYRDYVPLAANFSFQQIWASASYNLSTGRADFTNKPDTWTGWRSQFPAIAADALPIEYGAGHRSWSDCWVIEASNPEIIWPVWYQAFSTIHHLTAYNAQGGFIECWDPDTRPGLSQYPRRDNPADPYNTNLTYTGQFMVLRPPPYPPLPPALAYERIIAGIFYDQPWSLARYVGPASPGPDRIFPGESPNALPLGSIVTRNDVFNTFVCVANDYNALAGVINTSHFGMVDAWGFQLQQNVGAMPGNTFGTVTVWGGGTLAYNMGQQKTLQPRTMNMDIFFNSLTNGNCDFNAGDKVRFTTPH